MALPVDSLLPQPEGPRQLRLETISIVPRLRRDVCGMMTPAWALMVVDMQPRFWDHHKDASTMEALVERWVAAASYAKAQNVPVVLVKTIGKGEVDARIVTAAGGDAKQWPKNSDTAFDGKCGELREWLGTRKIETLVAGGLHSMVCVRRTVLGAIKYDYDVILPDDAHVNAWGEKAEQVSAAAAMEGAAVTGAGRVWNTKSLTDMKKWRTPGAVGKGLSEVVIAAREYRHSWENNLEGDSYGM